MIFRKSDAAAFNKNNVDMWIYNGKDDCSDAAVAYQETTTGHSEEFRHTRSAFVFYIIEGSGTWVIEGVEYSVEASDVVVVPPGKRFYCKGQFKQICVTAPAWEEQFEEHVRNVEL